MLTSKNEALTEIQSSLEKVLLNEYSLRDLGLALGIAHTTIMRILTGSCPNQITLRRLISWAESNIDFSQSQRFNERSETDEEDCLYSRLYDCDTCVNEVFCKIIHYATQLIGHYAEHMTPLVSVPILAQQIKIINELVTQRLSVKEAAKVLQMKSNSVYALLSPRNRFVTEPHLTSILKRLSLSQKFQAQETASQSLSELTEDDNFGAHPKEVPLDSSVRTDRLQQLFKESEEETE